MHSDQHPQESNRSYERRPVAFVFGILYFTVAGSIASNAADLSFSQGAMAIGAFIAWESFVLCALAGRWFQRRSDRRGVGLATLLLVITGAAPYLATWGFLVRRMWGDSAPPASAWIAYGIYFFTLAVLTTFVLVYFLDAVVGFGRAVFGKCED